MPNQLEIDIWKILESSLYYGLLIGAILVLIWAIVGLRTHLTIHQVREDFEHEMLFKMRDLQREGEISKEEFDSIKQRLLSETEGSTSSSVEAGSKDHVDSSESTGSSL